MSSGTYFERLNDSRIKNKIYKKYGLGGNFMLIAIVFMICGFFGGLNEGNKAFSSNYENTTAMVQEVKQYSSRHSTDYKITITYTDSTYQYYTGKVTSPTQVYVGDKVSVLYNKKNPKSVYYGTKGYHRKKFFGLMMFFIVGVLIAIRSKKSINKYKQQSFAM